MHLERRTILPKISQSADYLILAGDIGIPRSELYQEFIQRASRDYAHVFIVDGNHEWDKTCRQVCSSHCPKSPPRPTLPTNVILLEQSTFRLGNILLAGATLWTPFVQPGRHYNAVQFFERVFSDPETQSNKIICISHHLPSYEMISPKFKTHPKNHRYANRLDHFFHGPYAPTTWICGHSHDMTDMMIHNTRCLINPFPERWETRIRV